MNLLARSPVIVPASFVFMACTSAPTPISTPPTTGTVISIHDMITSRATHTSTLLPNGKVLITGGFDARGNTLASAEIFDPEARTFAPAGSMNIARLSHNATLLPNGKVLTAGGGIINRRIASKIACISSSCFPTFISRISQIVIC